MFPSESTFLEEKLKVINYGMVRTSQWCLIINILLIQIRVSVHYKENIQVLLFVFQVFYYSTNLFITTGLSEKQAKFATIGIGVVMVIMTLISIPLMDRSGRRSLHLYGLGGMFIFSIFITISFLVKVCKLIKLFFIVTKYNQYCSFYDFTL